LTVVPGSSREPGHGKNAAFGIGDDVTLAALHSFEWIKDFEKTIASAEAWVTIASIRVLSRRLARA
jgi:hypothetical protein